jgi:drug/metabolite transporter (DMT)-like permease
LALADRGAGACAFCLARACASAREAAGVLYISLAASVAAFICWNRGVAIVGANAAGFTLHLLPAFGTVLAMLLLGEAFHAYHAAGFATILVGVVLVTRRAEPAQGLR